MAKKVLFINQEIDPYVAESHMSIMGRELPPMNFIKSLFLIVE